MATGKSTAPTFVGHEDHREIPQEPNWLTGYLGNYPYTFAPLVYNIRGFPEGDEPVQPADLLKLIYEYLTGKYTNRSGTWLHGAGKWGGRARGVAEVDEPVQQADLTKPLMMDIARYGLTYAFYKYLTGDSDPSEKKYQPTQNPKHMIVVGAGIAGLAAAYELAQVGHSVTIVEMQTRFGGRVKTFNEKDGFAKGLYVDGEQAGGDMLIIFSCQILFLETSIVLWGGGDFNERFHCVFTAKRRSLRIVASVDFRLRYIYELFSKSLFT